MRTDSNIVICKFCGKSILMHLLGKHLKQEHDIDYLNLKFEKKEIKEITKKIDKKVAKSILSEEQKTALAEKVADAIVEKVKRKRGRPKKSESLIASQEQVDKMTEVPNENKEKDVVDVLLDALNNPKIHQDIHVGPGPLQEKADEIIENASKNLIPRDPTLRSAAAIENMNKGKEKHE